MVDREIMSLIGKGELKIDPFYNERLGPVSYDLTTKVAVIIADVTRLVSVEKLTLPRNIVGIIAPRSRIAKYNLFSSFSPLVDPGYSGHLIFLVHGPSTLGIWPRVTRDLFQIMFYKVEGVKTAYNERESSTAMGRENF